MSKRTFFVVSLGAVLSVAGLGWHLGMPSRQASPPRAESPVPVVTETIRSTDMPIVKTGIGSVVAYNSVAIHTQVTGTIQKIGFIEGQTVHKGSLIAQLDPRPFQANLEQAEANLQRDQAHLDNGQVNLALDISLQKRGTLSEQQERNQASAVAQEQAAVASDKAAIDFARTQLAYTTITSPIEGVTGIRKVDIGNLVQPSDATPIVAITQIQPISVVFTLPQTDLPVVQMAMSRGPLTVIAYSQDGSRELGTGTLLLIDNTVNQGSGTIELKGTFPNEDRALWPGAFVTIRLVIDVRHEAVTVPVTALQQGPAGSQVFVVNDDRTVRLRPVEVRETLGGKALIDQGLKLGDTVVTAGQYRLTDGAGIVSVPATSHRVVTASPGTQGMLP